MKHFVLKNLFPLLVLGLGFHQPCVSSTGDADDHFYDSLDCLSSAKTARLSTQTEIEDVLGLLSENNDLIIRVKNSPHSNPYKVVATFSQERTLPVGERINLNDKFPIFEALRSSADEIPSFINFEYSTDTGMTFSDCNDLRGEPFEIRLSQGCKKLDSIRFDIGRSSLDPENSSVRVSIAGCKYGNTPRLFATTTGSPLIRRKAPSSSAES